ncbi:MAG: hypothetical protein IJ161_08395 [Bacteroidales bacterium]|nr:hypothetical protein [Bacteroidales bacterium]
MDKKKQYLRFRHTFNHWLDVLGSIKKDVIEILKEGEIDLRKYPFGQQPYHFISIEEDLYPQRAYLDDNGIICIDAGATDDAESTSYVLGWDDMVQDTTTLADFMDCIFDNEGFKYDTEEEFDLESQSCFGGNLERAAVILDDISAMCADQEDHQDIVNFLADCATEVRKWKQVKKLVYDSEHDWDDAVETIKPLFLTKKPASEQNPDEKNPLNAPDLTPMLKAVKDFVTKHQGEKGFILTDRPEYDAIYSIEYNDEEGRADEFHVKAIRVKNNCLEILTDLYNVRFDEDAIAEIKDDEWLSVQFSDYVYFVPTLFNIVENLWEYVN